MIFSRIFYSLFMLMTMWLVGFVWFTNQIMLEEPKVNEKVDAIIVLTGAKGRIDAGMQLLSDKKADYLFISGVGQNAVLSDLSKYLTSFTPEQVESFKSSITLGHFASSTEENALETLEWIQKYRYKKIILVTSNYHMPRSLCLFKALLPDISITSYPSVKAPITLKLAFLEYNKYLLCIISNTCYRKK